MRELAADALGVLDSFGLRTAHLAGISMGGVAAQLVALDHPERVASLVLLSTSSGDAPGYPELPGPSLRLRMELDDVPVPDWADRGEVIDYLIAIERLLAGGRPFDEPAARGGRPGVRPRAAGAAVNGQSPGAGAD